jgi:hypothetical protein
MMTTMFIFICLVFLHKYLLAIEDYSNYSCPYPIVYAY